MRLDYLDTEDVGTPWLAPVFSLPIRLYAAFALHSRPIRVVSAFGYEAVIRLKRPKKSLKRSRPSSLRGSESPHIPNDSQGKRISRLGHDVRSIARLRSTDASVSVLTDLKRPKKGKRK